MNTESPSVNTAFRSLIQEFAQHAGLASEAAEIAYGVEFEVGNHRCRVLPHPNQDARLMAEVDVLNLGDGASGLSAAMGQLLLRVSAHARFEHDWVIGLDDDNHLMLWTSCEIAATAPGDMEALLVEGIERAEALADLLANAPVQMDSSHPAGAANTEGSSINASDLMNSLGSLRG